MSRKTHHSAHGVTEALIHTRVSSDDQEREGLRLPALSAVCRRYAAEKGWAIGTEYQDMLSGKRDDRPGYQRLLEDARRLRVEGRTVVVVAAWLHRFGRRELERVRSREELKALGAALHSAKGGALLSPVYIARPVAPRRQLVEVAEVLPAAPCRWPALVDESTWAQAQEQIARHRHLPRQATGRYLLKGVIRCPRCKARMTGGTERTHGPRYYCAGLMARGAGAPDVRSTTTVMAAHVNDCVLAVVQEIVTVVTDRANGDQRLRAELYRAWEQLRRPTGMNEATHRTKRLEAEVEKARARIRRATDLFVDGAIDKAEYDDKCRRERAELDVAQAELARLRAYRPPSPLPPLDEVLGEIGGWANVIAAMDVAAQRNVVAMLIERIVPVRVARGKYEPKIQWTAIGDGFDRLVTALRAPLAA
jgi:hypothetical protein